MKITGYRVPLAVSALIHGLVIFGNPHGSGVVDGMERERSEMTLQLVYSVPLSNHEKEIKGKREKEVEKPAEKREAGEKEGVADRERAKGEREVARPEKGTVNEQVPVDEGESSARGEVGQEAPMRAALEKPGETGTPVPPSVIYYPEPDYPDSSRRAGEEGVVVLKVSIDSRGEGNDVRVLKSSGFPRLDESAMKAMRGARFNPAIKGGVPVSSVKKISVKFKLEDDE